MAIAELPIDLAGVKLAAPPVRPGAVAKTDVIARLSASASPVATVVAPAGYGKTTLVARWSELDPRPFAWLALDGLDGDPVLFLRYIAAAIHGVEPVPPELLGALTGSGGPAWATRVAQLGSTLAEREQPFVLVLDDLHAVANGDCLELLAALPAYVPAGSQIAIASREQPPLPLGRWRAHGLVHEVDATDLRLDRHEADLLLRSAGVALEAEELAGLTDRTEGWPAGLYLAALSLQAGAASPASAADFAGDDRYVSEYFRFELLTRLPAADARFLRHTSVLGRMCGGLCDAVMQTTGSADTLAALERASCFLVPLDRRARWYRYHQLFRQLLRDELARTEPELEPELNARAMAWCIANDQPEAAVAYGQAAGDTEAVAELVEALAPRLYSEGRLETLDEWIGWFAEDELMRSPSLALLGAWMRVLTGRPADAARLLALAEDSDSTAVEPLAANLRAHMMRDGVGQARLDADLALGGLSEGSGWLTDALLIRGVVAALLGEPGEASASLRTAVERGRGAGAADDVFVAHAELALLAAARGAWGEAGHHARAAEALVEETGLGDYAASAIAYVAAARVALHEGRHADARAALARAHRLRPLLDHGLPWLTIQVGLELTRAHLTLGEAGAARTVLAETERVLELRPQMGSLVVEARELRERVTATTGSAGAWAMSLTGAEMRLLPYLATHLTFPEIAGRLYISRNTVKTEAVAIYRKLGASSRSEAIQRAVEVGLLESSIYPAEANLTP